jgi:cellulose synthase/poly-beta-1,6-N-acetylglucosamine synthase-like glycosyltransferase
MFEIKQRLGRHPMFMGSNCAIKKSTLEELGGFNEESLTEDLRIGLELRVRNKKVGFAPEARIQEIATSNWDDLKKQRLRWVVGYFRVLDEYKKRLGPVTGLSMMIHGNYPLVIIGTGIFAVIISLISMAIGIPLNHVILNSSPTLFVPFRLIELSFLNSYTLIFFNLDWMVLFFSFISLIFTISLLLSSIRKYGNKKYGLLRHFGWLLRIQWLHFSFHFRDVSKIQVGWEKTEKTI